MSITQECCEQYWTSPGGNTPQGTNYTANCLPPRKLYKLNEPDTLDTAGEAETSSSVIYSYGPSHMAKQKQDVQLEHTYSSYLRIRDVALRTCQKRLMIGVTFRPLVKQTTTRNLYITIYIYFLDGRLCEVGAVRRGIKIVRRWGLNFSMSGDEGRDNAHCVTTREVSWTAGSFFI